MAKSEQLTRIDYGSKHHRTLDTDTEYYIEVQDLDGIPNYIEHNVDAKGIHEGIFLSLSHNQKIGLPEQG